MPAALCVQNMFLSPHWCVIQPRLTHCTCLDNVSIRHPPQRAGCGALPLLMCYSILFNAPLLQTASYNNDKYASQLMGSIGDLQNTINNGKWSCGAELAPLPIPLALRAWPFPPPFTAACLG